MEPELGGLAPVSGGLLVREARPELVAEDLFSFLVIPRKFFCDSFLLESKRKESGEFRGIPPECPS